MSDNNSVTTPVFRPGLLKDEIMSTVLPGTTIAVFDTETTGLKPESTDRIIEFASMLWRVNKDLTLTKINEIQIYIRPPFQITQEIINLTGITNEFLANKPDEKDVVNEIYNFLKQADLVVGHNVMFDIHFIESMMSRNNKDNPINNYLDTLKLARDVIVKESVTNYKLGTLATALKFDKSLQFHSAFDDVYATSMLLQTILTQYLNQTIEQIDLIDLVINCVQYWEKNDIKRIYINTDKGALFFYLDGNYDSKDFDATRVDIEQIKKDAMKFIGVKSFKDLLAFRGKKRLFLGGK